MLSTGVNELSERNVIQFSLIMKLNALGGHTFMNIIINGMLLESENRNEF